MCTSPIQIKNNAKTYRQNIRYNMLVPCANCSECRSNAQDEWFARCWSEIDTYNKAGGKVLFVTLTYDDLHLPIFRDVDSDGNIWTMPCFDKTHKDIFLQKLRDFFRSQGINFNRPSENKLPKKSKYVYPNLSLKFIWASEYGMDESFTRRSHYHVLLFFPPESLSIPFFLDKSGLFVKQRLKDKVQEFWTYGMCRWSKPKPFGIFVTKEFAGLYVSKYMCKDIDFFDQPDVKAYLNNPDGTRIKFRWEKFKDFSAKHWQSKEFGIALTQLCQNDDVFKDGFTEQNSLFEPVILRRRKQGNYNKSFKVPRYIVRKVLYYTDSKGRIQLNERGVKLLSDKSNFEQKITKLNSDYIKFLNPLHIQSLIVRKEDYNILGIQPADSKAVTEFIKLYLGNRTISELSLYALALQGRGTVKKRFVFYNNMLSFQSMTLEQLYNASWHIFEQSKQNFKETDLFVDEGCLTNIKKSDFFTYDELPRFRGFNEILAIIQKIKGIASARRYEAYIENKEKKRKEKNQLIAV